MLVGAGLSGLGLVHGTLFAARSLSRGAGESLLSVAGFVALELLLLLPLLPVAGSQARRCLRTTDRRMPRLVLHAALALAVVAAYRGAVLSLVLLVELGEVPLRHLAGWWHHAGPWQLQADLLVYAGAGGLLALLPAAGSGSREGAARGSRDEARAAGRPAGREAERPRAGRGPERLTVSSGGSVHVLPVEEIRWIEGAGTYVRIHAAARSYLLRDTLESLAERLEPSGFVRVHRSAILSLRYLESLEPAPRGRWTARLTDGARVPVAASRTDALEAALGDTLGR